MTRRKRPHTDPPHLTVDYALLGMMTLEELKHALWTDIEVLRETYNVKYVKATKLRLELVNEFGETAQLKGLGDGKPIFRLHSRHFRPSCKDYGL